MATAQSDILTIAESGQADELRETILDKSNRSLYFFAKAVLGYKDLTESLHLPFCELIQNSIGKRKRGYLLPRGHFKSTILSKCYLLWRLTQNPELRILIVGESDDVAKKNLRDIMWHIQNNQVLAWLYPQLIPADFNEIKWTETEILLPRKGTYDESTIRTAGVGAKLTGTHYDLIDYDDIFGEKAARSEAEAEGIREWIQYAPGLANDQDTLEEIMAGTRWLHGERDIYGWMMKNLPEFDWYVRSAIEENESIFPERFSLARLEEIRNREGDYKYACQYLNTPTPPEGSDFPPSCIKYYHIGDNNILEPQDGTPPVALGQLLRMSFYDPSSGGKSARCEGAIAVAGMAADRRIFILDVWSANAGYGTAVEKWMTMKDRLLPYQDHYEAVGAQKEVEEIARLRNGEVICRMHTPPHKHRRLVPLPVSPEARTHKEDRIRAYAQRHFETGHVYLRRGMDKLRGQIISFPFGDMVDQFDAVAYLCKLLRPPLSDEQLSDIETQKAMESVKHQSRINTEYNYGGYC